MNDLDIEVACIIIEDMNIIPWLVSMVVVALSLDMSVVSHGRQTICGLQCGSLIVW